MVIYFLLSFLKKSPGLLADANMRDADSWCEPNCTDLNFESQHKARSSYS